MLRRHYKRKTGASGGRFARKIEFLVYTSLVVSQYRHGNKQPLELHLHATLACTLHEVNRLLFPLSICFLSHSPSFRIPHLFQSFSTFFIQPLQKSAGQSAVLFFGSVFQHFHSLFFCARLPNFRISKLKLYA